MRRSWRAVNRVGGNAPGKSISAATFTRCRATSNRVTGLKAVRPRRKPSALGFHPRPSAVMIPAPVITTRCREGECDLENNTTWFGELAKV